MIIWIFIGVLMSSQVYQPHFLQAADAAGSDQAPVVTLQKVAASFEQSYALDTKGELWAWGAYQSFMFGGLKNPKYIDFFKGKKIKDLQTGYNSATVLLEDGTVWVRAEGGSSKELFGQVPGLTRIQSIGTAPYYTYALDSDGKVWMWNGYAPDSYNFEKPKVISELEHIIQLTGDYAVTAEGTVWYLGMGRKEDARKLEGLTDVRQITVGNLNQTGYALKKDGTVWAWGNPNLETLKLPYLRTGSKEFFKAVQVSGMENVKELAAGFHHFLMLKEDGTVWAWGQNDKGQLGTGNTEDSVEPKQVKGLSDVESIFSGYQTDHSFAILKDQTVWGWGSNSEGETGTDSKTVAVKIPAQVMFAPVAEKATDHFTYNFLGGKGNNIDSVASNGTGTIIAVASSSLLISSDNGEHWAKNQIPASDNFSMVKHTGNNFYFWTYNTSDPKIFQSKDGKQWTPLNLEGPDGALTPRNVFLLRNQYVMAASYDADNHTYVFTSTDGIDWKQTGIIPSDKIYEILWNGARYTAISSGYRYYGSAKERNQFVIDSSDKQAGELVVYTSNDLSGWTQQSGTVKSSLTYRFTVNGVPVKNYDVNLMEPVANGIITLYDSYGNVLTSKDGITFTLKPGPEVFDKLYERGEMIQNGNQYFIFGGFWRDEIAVLTSKDKIHWSQVKIKNISLAMRVIKSGGRFVGFGQGGQIALSTDGVNWKIIRPALITQSMNQVIKANGRYTIIGGEFSYNVPMILSSKDGSTWSKVLSSDRFKTGPEDDIQSVEWNGKLYVAVGGAYTYTSKDGVKWQKQTTATGLNLKKVVWTGTRFAALGVSNSINNKKYVVYSSTNGVNWKVSLSTTSVLSDLAAHGGTLVAVGSKNQQGLAMSSKDLTKWQEKTFVLGSNNKDWKTGMSSASFDYDARVTFAGVQWVNDRFLIMSDMIYSSKDGVNWSTIKGNYDQFISERLEANSSGRILWTGKDYRYYKNHILGVSKDLISWKFYENEDMFSVNHMIWTGTDLLAVGSDGLLVRIKDKP
ncbi:hypothetical protein [Paenibacillus sp. sgz500958]|uniref:hypothetical protein n=1 Tax=Paenibacillus sp. sgz500958 TaxID=3242475 RepID=UPI0036D23838